EVELLLGRERPEVSNRAGQDDARGLSDVRGVEDAEEGSFGGRGGGQRGVGTAGRDQEGRNDGEPDQRRTEGGQEPERTPSIEVAERDRGPPVPFLEEQ